MNPPPASTAPAAGRGRGRGAPPAAGHPTTRRFNPYKRHAGAASSSTAPRIKTTAFALPSTATSDPTAHPSASAASSSPFSHAQCDQLIWLLYFADEPPQTPGTALDTKLRAAQQFVDRHRGTLFPLAAIAEQHVCSVLVRSLLDDVALLRTWPMLAADLNEQPDQTISCFELVLHKAIVRLPAASAGGGDDDTTAARINRCLRRVRLRLAGCQPCVSLSSLKVCNFGRLVTVSGTIIRASVAHLVCTWLCFECPACQARQIVAQTDGRITLPTRCIGGGGGGCRCQSGFQPQLGSAHTRTVPVQRVRLQESQQVAQFEAGRVPRTVEMEFGADLVDACSPGDELTVTGVLRVQKEDGDGGGGGSVPPSKSLAPSMHLLYLDAVAVACDKNVMKMRRIEFSELDLEVIGRIRAEPDVLRLLVHSLCPGIYGHEMVKAGLLLGLFGATGNAAFAPHKAAAPTHPIASNVPAVAATPQPAATASASAHRRRSEAHILVVGDPGVGKSQMLQACAAVAPRGIFVCGNSSSRAGLTVSVRHERGSGNTLEAGALVLADQGCCAIDEFDKMAGLHEALLEVMEDQQVSVAKAGVLCSLPARTCVLAAANPSGGHYDPGRTLAANLRMNAALLSRFDLVFVLLDRPDEHTDRLMTAHITAMYATAERQQQQQQQSSTGGTATPAGATQTDRQQSLLGRLRARHSSDDALPHVLMQKYIGYARKNCHPRLSAGAADVLRRFYLERRAEPRGPNATPCTTRQLEALVRLTQARARIDLAPLARRTHALDVLDVVRHSQAEVRRSGGISAGGATQQHQLQSGAKPLGQSAQMRRLLAALRRHSGAVGRTVFAMDELRDVAATVPGVSVDECGRLVDGLNMQGVLLKKGQHMYKLLAN